MRFAPGSVIGPYEITAELGQGGMGEVYRARDSNLGREVALKVLPERFTADNERLMRFEREAKLLAQLNHPHVAQIYGLEKSGPTRALVMELVEGETLAERLQRGRLPLEESLTIAGQIARALEAAHEKGIVHRDLKPHNVKVSPAGQVKVLDFGLAKAMEGSAGTPSASQLANSPTVPGVTGTELGIILGTAAYMSPEQAKGLPVDKRADVWAFGCLLYEMLTGRILFAGESLTETLAAVLRGGIDQAALPQDVPPAIRRLLRQCLERNPANRLHDIADARIVIDEVLAGHDAAEGAGAAAPRAGYGARHLLLAALAAAAVAAALAWLVQRWAPSPGSTTVAAGPSFRQLTKLPGGEFAPCLSPDGESFVFVKQDEGDTDLFLQRIDGTTAIRLTGDCGQDDGQPSFSPDGRSIAYRSECGGGGIFVMGATGEAIRRVGDFGYSPVWSPDGKELAVVTEAPSLPTSRISQSELWAVRVDSGQRRLVSRHDAMGPTWSPDGRRIAFWGLRGASFQRDLWSVASDGSESEPEAALSLVDDPAVDWAPVFSADGKWLHFGSSRGGTFNLWRLPIDPANGRPRGAPDPLTAPSSWAGPSTVSADGRRVIYVDRNAETAIVRARLDPARRRLAAEPVPAAIGSFEMRDAMLAPDGSMILFTNEDLPQQLHLVRPDGAGYRQLTTGDDRNRQGAWSPNGEWIAFQTSRGEYCLAMIHPDGSGWQALGTDTGCSDPVWAPDGSALAVLDASEPSYLLDLRAGPAAAVRHDLPPPGEGRVFWPVAWSPDGALLAGVRLAAGRSEAMIVLSLEDRVYRELPWSYDRTPRTRWAAFIDRSNLAVLDGRKLWLGDVRGGEPRILYTAPVGHTLASLSATADGRWLAWIDRSNESDIWLMTLEEPPGGSL